MTFNEIFSFENLLLAHKRAEKCKRGKKDIIEFETELSVNLWDLHNKLIEGTYKVSGYHKFFVYEPKKREIQALLYKDRVVQHALCDLYLYPLLTARFIYDNGACQKGKGTDFALNRLSQFFVGYYKEHKTNKGYILKADIHHFFPSISHDVLKKMLAKVVTDKQILALLFDIIDSYNEQEGVGIPMGNQTSQLFALFYLDKLDRLVKEKYRIKYYVRYMDDMIIIDESKEKLKYLLEKMTQLVENELKLEFNQKTQIFPIKNGVDFLGFHFYMTETGKLVRKLRNSSKKRFKKRMKKLCEQINNGEKTMDDLKKVLPGFNGHMKRGDTWNFRKKRSFRMLFKLPSETADMKEFKELILKSRNFALRTVDMYNVIKRPDIDMHFAKETVKNAGETYLLLSEVLEKGNSQQDIEFFLMTARKSVKAAILNLSYLKKSNRLTQKQFQSMNRDAKEILFLLREILKKTEDFYEDY